jgi:hypothetical protein
MEAVGAEHFGPSRRQFAAERMEVGERQPVSRRCGRDVLVEHLDALLVRRLWHEPRRRWRERQIGDVGDGYRCPQLPQGHDDLLQVERERVIGDLQTDVVDADADGDEARTRSARGNCSSIRPAVVALLRQRFSSLQARMCGAQPAQEPLWVAAGGARADAETGRVAQRHVQFRRHPRV